MHTSQNPPTGKRPKHSIATTDPGGQQKVPTAWEQRKSVDRRWSIEGPPASLDGRRRAGGPRIGRPKRSRQDHEQPATRAGWMCLLERRRLRGPARCCGPSSCRARRSCRSRPTRRDEAARRCWRRLLPGDESGWPGPRPFISRWHRAGYGVGLAFIALRSPELAVARVATRVALEGHDVPEAVVRRRWRAGLEARFDVYIQVVDDWWLIDNSDDMAVIVARGVARHVR